MPTWELMRLRVWPLWCLGARGHAGRYFIHTAMGQRGLHVTWQARAPLVLHEGLSGGRPRRCKMFRDALLDANWLSLRSRRLISLLACGAWAERFSRLTRFLVYFFLHCLTLHTTGWAPRPQDRLAASLGTLTFVFSSPACGVFRAAEQDPRHAPAPSRPDSSLTVKY